MGGAQKIIFNTGITYARAIVTSLISLYATRLVLQALGASDFGLFNVIGGIIAVLSFLNAAMTTSTQRYLSFNIGKGDIEHVKKIFANSIIVHLLLAILIVAVIEFLGVFFIDYYLQIEPSRIKTAKYIMHFALASTFLTVISVPYDALINAHEDMSFLAIVSIIESVLKIVVAFSILYIPGDRLLYYGLLTAISAMMIRFLKQRFVSKRYKESEISFKSLYSLKIIKELGSFASWNLFGTLCSLGRNQGVAIVLNLFYSTVVNAAYGIANQINAQMMFFSQTMMSAVRPQIMKSEGANDRSRMIRLSLSANRISFYLFSFFAIPLYIKMPVLLDLWLKDVPDYAVEFCRAIIFLTAVNQINMGLMTAVQAIGKIKIYQIVAGGIQLLTLPLGFLFLHYGYKPYSIIYISFVLECVSTLFRMFYFKYLTGYSILQYFTEVILRSTLTALPCILFLLFLKDKISDDLIGILICTIISFIVYGGCILFYGLNKDERKIFTDLLKKLKLKFHG